MYRNWLGLGADWSSRRIVFRSPGTLRPLHQQPFAVDIQVHQGEARAQPIVVLRDATVSRLVEAEDALQDAERMFYFRPHPRLASVLLPLQLVLKRIGDIVMRSRCIGIFIAFLIMFMGNVYLHAEVKVLRVDPQQTDSAIATVHGPHIAVYDPQVASRHRLFLFLSGTGDKAEGSLTIDSAYAGWGYHAISLDYEDNVVAVSNAHSLDSTSFDRYRDAIVTGAPVSTQIKVNPANSILNRFQKLLLYLVKEDPNGGWGEFVANGQPVWNHIIVAGHSQGSGHAAYIGKLFRVDRVLMFSGPQDYMDDLHAPAPWLSRKGATPPSRFFAFLNLEDPLNVHHQIANCIALMDISKPATPMDMPGLMVKPGEVIDGNYQILINDFPTKQHHGSTLFPQFENVWKYMATTKIR